MKPKGKGRKCESEVVSRDFENGLSRRQREEQYLTPVIPSAAALPVIPSVARNLALFFERSRSARSSRANAVAVVALRDSLREDVLRLHHGEQVAHPLYGRHRRPREARSRTQAQASSGIHGALQHQQAYLFRDIRTRPRRHLPRETDHGLAAGEEDRIDRVYEPRLERLEHGLGWQGRELNGRPTF